MERALARPGRGQAGNVVCIVGFLVAFLRPMVAHERPIWALNP